MRMSHLFCPQIRDLHHLKWDFFSREVAWINHLHTKAPAHKTQLFCPGGAESLTSQTLFQDELIVLFQHGRRTALSSIYTQRYIDFLPRRDLNEGLVIVPIIIAVKGPELWEREGLCTYLFEAFNSFALCQIETSKFCMTNQRAQWPHFPSLQRRACDASLFR